MVSLTSDDVLTVTRHTPWVQVHAGPGIGSAAHRRTPSLHPQAQQLPGKQARRGPGRGLLRWLFASLSVSVPAGRLPCSTPAGTPRSCFRAQLSLVVMSLQPRALTPPRPPSQVEGLPPGPQHCHSPCRAGHQAPSRPCTGTDCECELSSIQPTFLGPLLIE